MQPIFREAQDEVKGRKALATRAIHRGSRVLSTPAFAAVSVSACNWCMAAGRTLSRCGGCRQVRYCSRRCQQQDWTAGGHSMECASWRQIPAGVDVSQSVLLASRLAARIHMTPAPEADCVLALRHHHEDHTPAKLAQFADVAQLVLLLLQRSKYNAAQLELPALRSQLQDKIVLLLCRMNCNAFTICDDACTPVGLGIFPHGALFNHSCEPNCIVSFHSRQMNVYAIADIAQDQELLVSYVDVLASSSTRQRELRESYFFSCQCERCCSEDAALENAYLDGYVCPDASCTQTKGGVLVLNSKGDYACRVCGVERSTSELQQLEREYTELSARRSSDPVALWQHYRRCWQLLAVDVGAHPRSTRVATLARAMGNFLLNEPSLDAGEFTAGLCFQRELAAVQWILPELPLPARGLLHYALGKYTHECQQTLAAEATEHLRQALVVLSCAYGRENALVGAIQTLLDDIHRGD